MSAVEHGERPVKLVTYLIKALPSGYDVQPTHTSCAFPSPLTPVLRALVAGQASDQPPASPGATGMASACSINSGPLLRTELTSVATG